MVLIFRILLPITITKKTPHVPEKRKQPAPHGATDDRVVSAGHLGSGRRLPTRQQHQFEKRCGRRQAMFNAWWETIGPEHFRYAQFQDNFPSLGQEKA